ncbi:MAG TPA: hypothetical protein VK419_03600 [Bryobacteraceae bacterium]|nr:hypothetical protein [Bryobacteraceae bacterium]
MTPLSPIELDVWYLNIAATIALLVRLSGSGLIRRYRWLGIYLLVDLTESLLFLYFLRIHTPRAYRSYAETYMAGQGVKMILAVFVLLELYRLALVSQPAIARFGRQSVGYALAVAAAIAAVGLLLDRSAPKDQPLLLYRYYAVERTMDVWALIFLVLITAFMLWFPVKLMRNVAYYLLGFIVYFSARSAGLLVMNLLTGRYTPLVNTAMLGISFCCLMFWAVGLRRENQDRTTVIGHRWDASAMLRLTRQLDAINASLLRLSGDDQK